MSGIEELSIVFLQLFHKSKTINILRLKVYFFLKVPSSSLTRTSSNRLQGESWKYSGKRIKCLFLKLHCFFHWKTTKKFISWSLSEAAYLKSEFINKLTSKGPLRRKYHGLDQKQIPSLCFHLQYTVLPSLWREITTSQELELDASIRT